jgi:hypothetical protein
MAEQYTNIRLILDKILRHPLMKELSFETIVDYTVDFMRIVGTPTMFEEKTETLIVDNYRAKLPNDYYTIISLKTDKGIPFNSVNDLSYTNSNNNSLTYKIQGGIIYTSLEKGNIDITYNAIMIDKDGFPLIPDNSSFTRALEAYIKKQWFTILFDLGKINQAVLQNTQQEYAWAVGDCQTEFNRMSLDKAESFYKMWRSTVLSNYSYYANSIIQNK